MVIQFSNHLLASLTYHEKIHFSVDQLFNELNLKHNEKPSFKVWLIYDCYYYASKINQSLIFY